MGEHDLADRKVRRQDLPHENSRDLRKQVLPFLDPIGFPLVFDGVPTYANEKDVHEHYL